MHETIVLADQHDSFAEILPSRGALISRFFAAGEEVLFVDAPALADPKANVHGGIPVLFPIAGKLPDGKYQHGAKTFAMAQHGFARTRAWRVIEKASDRLRCALESDEGTLAQFPWRFGAEFEASVVNGTLSISLTATNRDTSPMPFHAGFHPYFSIPRAAKSEARIETDARHAFDNVSGTRGPISKIDLNELDLHLEDHTRNGTTLQRGAARRPIVLEWSGASRVVLWSQRQADFICVEPWTAAGGALATGDPKLVWIAPGASAKLAMSIRLG